MLEVTDYITIPRQELRFTYARSPGPGGQNVNKVNSKAVLHWDVTKTTSLPAPVRERFLKLFANRINNDGELVLNSTRHRDAPKNMEDCREKLREMILAAVVVPKKRRPTRPSAGSNKRRLKSKKQNAKKKQGRKPPSMD